MLIPELPISSLGIQKGDQLIVNVLKGPTATTTAQPPANPAVTKPTTTTHKPSPANPIRSATTSNQAESVPVPGGVLIHRVNLSQCVADPTSG
jgi:ubiquitin thioesterase OTU1